MGKGETQGMNAVQMATGVALGGLLALGRWLEGAMPLLWAVLAVLAALAALCAVWEPARSGLPGLWRRLSGDRGVTRKPVSYTHLTLPTKA